MRGGMTARKTYPQSIAPGHSFSQTPDNRGMTADIGRFLTPADVAEILNVSVAEVTEMIREGELPAIQLNAGLWRVERTVLREFIDGKYEEARRLALWNQASFVDLPEFSDSFDERNFNAPTLR